MTWKLDRNNLNWNITDLKITISWVQNWILQGLEAMTTALGNWGSILDTKSWTRELGNGGLGKMLANPGSLGPGTNTNLEFSKRGRCSLSSIKSPRDLKSSLKTLLFWGPISEVDPMKFPMKIKAVGGILEYPKNKVFNRAITSGRSNQRSEMNTNIAPSFCSSTTFSLWSALGVISRGPPKKLIEPKIERVVSDDSMEGWPNEKLGYEQCCQLWWRFSNGNTWNEKKHT